MLTVHTLPLGEHPVQLTVGFLHLVELDQAPGIAGKVRRVVIATQA
jgi:hypothetical protein